MRHILTTHHNQTLNKENVRWYWLTLFCHWTKCECEQDANAQYMERFLNFQKHFYAFSKRSINYYEKYYNWTIKLINLCAQFFFYLEKNHICVQINRPQTFTWTNFKFDTQLERILSEKNAWEKISVRLCQTWQRVSFTPWHHHTILLDTTR